MHEGAQTCFGFQHGIQRQELAFPLREHKVKVEGVSNRDGDAEDQNIRCLKQRRGE